MALDYLNSSDNAMVAAENDGLFAIGEMPPALVKTFAATFPLTMKLDGNILYTAVRTAKIIHRLNVETFTALSSFSQTNAPDGVLIHNGMLYVAHTGALTPVYKGIKRYDLQTGAYIDSFLDGIPVWALTKTDTHLYATNLTSRTITELNLADNSISRTLVTPEAGNTAGVAVDAANNRIWYTIEGFTNLYERKLSDFSLNRTLAGIGNQAYTLEYNAGLSRVFIGGAGATRVYSINLATWTIYKSVTSAQGGLAYPSGFALDLTRRRCFICGNNTIKSFDYRLLE